MWQEILLAIGPSILDASIGKLIKTQDRKRIKNTLNNTVKKLFGEFADSSLDTDEFFDLINSYRFNDLLQKYFFALKDGAGTSSFNESIYNYVKSTCPNANIHDIKEFFNKINVIYTDFLHRIIEQEPQLNALFQLITISQRSIISKMSEGFDAPIKYFDSLKNAEKSITNEAIKQFHHTCEKEYGIIRFTGIADAERQPDQDLKTFYIENTFSFYNVRSAGVYSNMPLRKTELHINDLFDFSNKVIIIGGAGYGKTTTLNYIYCNYENIFHTYPLKIKLDLKEYAEDISAAKTPILTCLAKQFLRKSKTRTNQLDEIEKLIKEYLDDGKCLIIFDALDEIATQNARNTVRTEIANFSDMYYLNHFIISTREVGYLRNKFDNSFLHLRINSFDLDQIKTYSRNWRKVQCENSLKKDNDTFDNFDEFWDAFYNEAFKARCTTLIANPIILILALIVFDMDNNLPNRRVKFYKKCIKTFLREREDRNPTRELSKNAKNILSDDTIIPKVAHYKYQKTNESISYSFTSSELKTSITNAIGVSDMINWSSAIDEYIRYLIERTELIGETDEDVLDFAHKTFYEYFLALYFSLQLESKKLQRQLVKWTGDANFHELGQLIIEKIIESGDPFKQKEILDYLFNAINIEKQSKRRDILHLISDLYMDNVLPLKYFEQYYLTIITNSELLYEWPQINANDTKILYDADELATVYTNYVDNEEKFIETFESLVHLNDEFKKNIYNNFFDYTLLNSALTLIDASSPFFNKLHISNDKVLQAIEYFINDKYDVLLKSPILFVILINDVFAYDLYDNISLEKLILRDVSQNSYFYNYSLPQVLIDIFDIAQNNSDAFTLVLQLIINYSLYGTNNIIGYALKATKSIHENIGNVKPFVHWIWETLNSSTNSFDFINALSKKRCYNSIYNDVYETAFNMYIKNEKDKHDVRIDEYI